MPLISHKLRALARRSEPARRGGPQTCRQRSRSARGPAAWLSASNRRRAIASQRAAAAGARPLTWLTKMAGFCRSGGGLRGVCCRAFQKLTQARAAAPSSACRARVDPEVAAAVRGQEAADLVDGWAATHLGRPQSRCPSHPLAAVHVDRRHPFL